MTDRATWERLIDSDPTEALNHLAFADWLAEQGDHEEADFRRAMGELAQDRGRSGMYKEVVEQYGYPWTTGSKRIPWLDRKHIDVIDSHEIPPPGTHDESRPIEAWNTHYWSSYRGMESALRKAFFANRQSQSPEQFAKSISRAINRT